MNELALLLATDAVTYSKHVRDMLMMDAEARVAKAQIDYIARMAQHRVRRELKRLEEENDDSGRTCPPGDPAPGH
jgi:hypothetical protein